MTSVSSNVFESVPLAGYSMEMEPSSASTMPNKITFPDIRPELRGDSAEAAKVFAESVAIMARLRGPGGCPWDGEQSFDSIRKYTLEETYEVLDAIERRDFAHLTEELGDLLLQVLFYSQMAADEGRFTITDVLGALNRKLIRRHPHVFGEKASAAAGNTAKVNAKADGANQISSARVLANWEEIKKAEKKAQAKGSETPSLLDEVKSAQPALAEAVKLGTKAAKVGFDWEHWRELLEKLDEETAELVAAADASPDTAARQRDVEAEVGDLLFTTVNLGRHLDVDPEMALRGTNARFRRRFREMERIARKTIGKSLSELPPEELEALWVRAKEEVPKTTAGAGK